MLARIRLFHNFCTIVKERRTKYRRIIGQFSRDQLLFIDESAKRWQDFSGKYQYNRLCKTEKTFYAISGVDVTMTDILKTQNPLQVFKTDKRSLSTRHIWYDWRQLKHNFLLMKNLQWSRKIENGGNRYPAKSIALLSSIISHVTVLSVYWSTCCFSKILDIRTGWFWPGIEVLILLAKSVSK